MTIDVLNVLKTFIIKIQNISSYIKPKDEMKFYELYNICSQMRGLKVLPLKVYQSCEIPNLWQKANYYITDLSYPKIYEV